MKEVYVR